VNVFLHDFELDAARAGGAHGVDRRPEQTLSVTLPAQLGPHAHQREPRALAALREYDRADERPILEC